VPGAPGREEKRREEKRDGNTEVTEARTKRTQRRVAAQAGTLGFEERA
jgi:hypothetical protein